MINTIGKQYSYNLNNYMKNDDSGKEQVEKDVKKQTSDTGVTLELSNEYYTQKDSVYTKSMISESKAARKSSAAIGVAGSVTPLKQGSKGADVKRLQQNLMSLGYDTKGADGIFGAGTKSAVMKFQEVYGLTVDGIAGMNTKNAIDRVVNNKRLGGLTRGLISGEVKTLQSNLKTLGYYSGSVDGIFGAGTETAVKRYQVSKGLAQDGVAGSGTQKSIASDLALKAAAEAARKAAEEAAKKGVLQTGSKGDTVLNLQKNLVTLGYNPKGCDGIYGADTKTAVMKFQQVYGLEVDGVAGKDTLNAINSAVALKHAGNISRGMVSEDVGEIQSGLKQLGYYTGSVDGVFGSGTEAAVMKFQKDNKQSADGIVRQITKTVMEAALAFAKKIHGGKVPDDSAKVTKTNLETPKPGTLITVSKGTDLPNQTAEVYSWNAWAIEYSIAKCRHDNPGKPCTNRLNAALSKFASNQNDTDLLKFNIPGFGICYAGAMVDGFGEMGDIAEVKLDDGTKFNFLLLDTKSLKHDSAQLKANSTEDKPQIMNKWGHGYLLGKEKYAQLSVCEFIVTKKIDGSAINYKSGGFLKERSVVSAKIVGHVDVE